jgi:hypothetical protein
MSKELNPSKNVFSRVFVCARQVILTLEENELVATVFLSKNQSLAAAAWWDKICMIIIVVIWPHCSVPYMFNKPASG